jgi:peptidoglycan/LPS O-acetylase OafA/YrhL
LKPQIPELTSIRFFAVLWVVLFHSGLPNGLLYDCLTYDAPFYVHDFIRTGYLAVTIFFTLSGFVLAYNYDRIETAYERRMFWLGRISRIYPVYLIGWVLLVPIVLDSILPPPFTGASVVRFLSNGLMSLFLIQAWIPQYALTWNTPCWILSCEMFFYFLYPFTLPLIQAWKERTLIVAIAGIWVFSLIVPAFAVMLSMDGYGLKYANEITSTSIPVRLIKFNPIMRLPEFLVGVLLGRLYLNRKGKAEKQSETGRRKCLAIVPLAVMILCCGFLAGRIYQPLIYCGGLLTLVIGAHVYQLAQGGSLMPRVMRHRLLVTLGQSSYAIFILHYPLLLWLESMDKGHFSKQYPLTVFLLYFVLTVGLSCLIFRLVEEPCRRWLREYFFRAESTGPYGTSGP